MKYNYSVKVDGKWYRPNTEIPDKVVNSKKETTATVSKKETVKK